MRTYIHSIFLVFLLFSAAFAQIPEVHDSLVSENSNPIVSESFDSPHARFWDEADYQAMPIPTFTAPNFKTQYPEQEVMYDLISHTEQLASTDSLGMAFPGAAFQMSGNGAYASNATLSPPNKNFGPLYRIYQQDVYPHSFSVKMFITNADGSNSVCSGILIKPNWVLTAGHCIYNHNRGGWADKVVVVPAYEDGDRPFGESIGVKFHSWTGWTQNKDYGWDMAYVRLNRPVGCLTGWAGYGYTSDNNYYTSTTFYNPGYPAESPYSGKYMYESNGTYDFFNGDRILKINRDLYGGQSGSGSYNSDKRVHAVHSHSNGTTSGQTRMTSTTFNSISTKIDDHLPSSPDLIPLAVHADGVYPGQRIQNGYFLLYNYSSQSWNGTLTYSVYLSHNNNISETDTWLQRRSVQVNMAPGERKWIYMNGNAPRIPSSTACNGTYYLGVILENQDSKTTNNDTDAFDAAEMNLWCTSNENLLAQSVNLSLYPNPTQGKASLRFELMESANVSIQLIDLLGRTYPIQYTTQTLYTGRHEIPLDLSALPTNYYILKLQAGDKVYSQKIQRLP